VLPVFWLCVKPARLEDQPATVTKINWRIIGNYRSSIPMTWIPRRMLPEPDPQKKENPAR